MKKMTMLLNTEDESILEKLSKERKAGIKEGTIPKWMVTPSYQLFKAKYAYKDGTVKDTYCRIAKAAALHMSKDKKNDIKYWEEKFFEVMWKGWLCCSTPVLANMGTDRGCPVSCSGNFVNDSIYGFYSGQVETAMLTKNGFGTSSYLGDVRGRGSMISSGGQSSGVVPVIDDYVQLSRDVSQGNTRRGAWAGYIEIDHPDFWELADHLQANPDDLNIGWIVTQEFIDKLNAGHEDSVLRYKRSLKLKCITGKGYYFFIDKVNADNPPMYIENDLSVKASNLCTEIALHSDNDHTFTCVLSSMNASKYDEWKDTDAVFVATVFLDCVAEEFIKMGSKIRGLEKAVRFTEKGRALGLGVLGLHTYFQEHKMPFGSIEAHMFNNLLFDNLNKESLRASKWMGEVWGNPEWCVGFGVHNTHRIAVAPNSSSALIAGGVSQGIEPIVENVYNQPTAAGEIARINPTLLAIMKKRDKYKKKYIKDIIEHDGSVQHVDYLDDDEKEVFKTAFEINQMDLIRLASSRQRYIDQAQSLNLFFDADEDEGYISKIHQAAFEDPRIKSLYYLRSKAGIKAAKEEVCLACEG